MNYVLELSDLLEMGVSQQGWLSDSPIQIKVILSLCMPDTLLADIVIFLYFWREANT